MISVITCNEYALDFVSDKGLNFGCISFDGNPLGYYFVQSRYQGKILYNGGVPFIYSLFYDVVEESFVLGPAIITYKQGIPQCGIPRNP